MGVEEYVEIYQNGYCAYIDGVFGKQYVIGEEYFVVYFPTFLCMFYLITGKER